MCGLAGFSISQEHAENITTQKLYDAIEVGIKENMHRGKDAMGFFLSAIEEEKQALWFWKRSGPGDDDKTLAEVKRYLETGIEKPITLGIHTRGMSAGFPATNIGNNHPVIYNKVLVNHNGMIRNHSVLKQNTALFNSDATYDKFRPPVDSIIIPMLLDKIEDPANNPEEVANALSYLKGGWAFHAVWEQHPELSLLVAGPEYPLTVRFGKGRFGYSSEPEAITKMFDTLDMPWVKKGKIREMDTGTFMLLNAGEPVYFGEYDWEHKEQDKLLRAAGLSSNNNTWERHIPDPEDGKKFSIFTGSGLRKTVAGHPTSSIGYWSSTLVPSDQITCLYSQEHGAFINDDTKEYWEGLSQVKNTFNGVKDGDPPAAFAKKNCLELLAEADTILVHKANSYDSILYAWFGNKEIVTNDTGTLIGVYDWGHSTIPRYVTENEIAEQQKERYLKVIKTYSPLLAIEEQAGKFTSWIMSNSIDAKQSTKTGIIGGGQGKVVGASGMIPIGSSAATSNQTNEHMQAITFCTKQLEQIGGRFPNDVTNIPILELYDWMAGPDYTEDDIIGDDTKDQFMRHKKSKFASMIFDDWDYCPVHYDELTEHDDPDECEFTLAKALIVAARAGDIGVLAKLYDPYMKWTTDFTGTDIGAWEACEHKWTPSKVIEVPMWEVPVTIIQRDMCQKCGVKRYIDRYPKFIEDVRTHIMTKESEWS